MPGYLLMSHLLGEVGLANRVYVNAQKIPQLPTYAAA